MRAGYGQRQHVYEIIGQSMLGIAVQSNLL